MFGMYVEMYGKKTRIYKLYYAHVGIFDVYGE